MRRRRKNAAGHLGASISIQFYYSPTRLSLAYLRN